MHRPTSPTTDLEARFEAELGPLVATLLGVVGPMSAERIRVVLTRAGHFDPLLAEGYDRDDLQGLVDWVVDDELAFFVTGDGLVAHVPSLLEGVVVTHVLTAAEAERGLLDVGPDLSVLLRTGHRLPLLGGGEVVVHHRWDQRAELARAAAELGLPTDPRAGDAGSLVGPPGWLRGWRPGTPVVAGLHAGILAVVPSATGTLPGAPTPALIDALGAAAERREHGDPVDDLLLDALAHDPTLLRAPDAPLGAAVEGLRRAAHGEAPPPPPDSVSPVIPSSGWPR